MRTLRIRTFTLLCFLFILSLPWIFFLTAHFMETKTLSIANSGLQNKALQAKLNGIIARIEAGSDKWRDPIWQTKLHEELRKANMDAAILSASDQEIYRSNPERRGSLRSTERISVIEDGHLLGRAVIYLPKSNTVQMISAFAGFLLAFFIIAVEMRRFLLKPLEKMGNAARQIAAGDWDVRLPRSRITEIAEVRDGFEAMVNGLQKSYRKQAELEEERRFVIAAVAHDLRTPLFALRGYLDGLEQGIAESPEKMAKYLAVCKEKSAQLDRLVEDLFTFTKMEYLKTELNNNTVDIKLILQKSVDSLSPLARQKQIPILVHAGDDLLINGDAHFMERAMNNLLDNAVRHTPIGGEIVVQGYKAGDKVKFTIRDTGPGFSSEELKRVFEPLYRGEVSRNRSTGGSGLGLTISQRIVRRHGGELAASNHPEGGALLAGWLPVAAPDSAYAGKAERPK
ncbi:MAG: HAMP domain-containing sensor histidine kinase [Paenibacillus macerans]|uniref:histidine kinase n=1 Tax=Paenibacillus macerans TaxID=44252 RepID=A0A090ZEQ1_PAEMA|nr:HAMP domain-containing sensor histidine kinase [Paenibacillus macerans]KFN08908.1 HAMP domain protein [Paenibacillus macerans]MBS5914515.1 HAMP domain-containing histidine kinase [Paenibacillus macerans]MCY7561071.1 HAMP domain-containing histidine kinase [Paenibacillus macerans]MDU7475617.1 HAMP domain-containing sensor histidine kinase [Paenibacillus macerans]MEC0135825.1 HAMP domain-containing sensor histidine kinase [Paenibacillus macerans]